MTLPDMQENEAVIIEDWENSNLLTRRQRVALQRIRAGVIQHDMLGSIDAQDKYEFKQWEVKYYPITDGWQERRKEMAELLDKRFVRAFPTAFLVSETGLREDEGTAAMFVRKHRHIAVGARGGMELLSARDEGRKKVTGSKVWWARSW